MSVVSQFDKSFRQFGRPIWLNVLAVRRTDVLADRCNGRWETRPVLFTIPYQYLYWT